jgi:hypothetical protein
LAPPDHPGSVGQETIDATAAVSDPNPSGSSTETVYGTILRNGQGIPNVPMSATWYMRTGIVTCSATTDDRGKAACSHDTTAAKLGFKVGVRVTFSLDGGAYVADTGFTPH